MVEKSQADLWWIIAQIQEKLGADVLGDVRIPRSSSLQLSLEHKVLGDMEAEFEKALSGSVASRERSVGCAYAINGEIYGAQIYPCHSLFVKVWPKLLHASILEALLLRKEGEVASAPSIDAVRAFLEKAERGEIKGERRSNLSRTITRETGKTILVEAGSSTWRHHVYMAKRAETSNPERVLAGIQERLGVSVLGDVIVNVPKIDGHVVGVSKTVNLVVISVGEEDGVRVGFEFTVHRGNAFVGKLIVEKVFPKQAACRVLLDMTKDRVREKDRVSTHVY
jgi:hypothetical protein